MAVCASPMHFAAYCVLPRCQIPRHPLYALIFLVLSLITALYSLVNIIRVISYQMRYKHFNNAHVLSLENYSIERR